MYNRNLIRIVLPLFLVSQSGESAQADENTTQAPETFDSPSPLPAGSSARLGSFDSSSWYFYVGVGIGRPKYDADIEERFDRQKASGARSPEAAFVDLPGIYRRLADEWLLGAVLNASFENAARKWGDNDSFAVHSYNPAVSTLYFPSGKMGVGFFARGDLGFSRILQIREYIDNARNEHRYDRLNDDGAFTQLGAGYGFRATDLARLLFSINATRATGRDHSIEGFNFNVGFMF